MSPLPESDMMRTLRQYALDARKLRPFDAFCLCLGYALLIGVLLFLVVATATALDDWASGRPASVAAQISAAIATLDARP